MSRRFESFTEFYPYYLEEHSTKPCRRLHFAGTSLVIATALAAPILGNAYVLLLMPVFGYGLAWAGHFFFEKNRPATFTNPLYSLRGDWTMYCDMLIGRIKW